MKRSLAILLISATTVFFAACGAGGEADEAEPAAAAASDVCSRLADLEASLEELEDSDSFEEYESRYEDVKEDFAALRGADEASGGEFADELSSFEAAMDEFGQSLTSLGEGGILSGMLGLASDAADLAVAGDRLDDAIDC